MISNKRFIAVGMFALASAGSAFGATFSTSTNATAYQANAGSLADPHSASGAAPVSVASQNIWTNVIDNPYGITGNTLTLDARSGASAAASLGALHVYASATVKAQTANPQVINNPAGPDSANASSSAQAVMNDSFTIRSAGITDGTPGTLTAYLLVDGTSSGTLTNDNSENYGWALNARLITQGLNGGAGFNVVHYLNGSGNPLPLASGQTYGNPGLYTISVGFLFGAPIDLSLDARASISGARAECSFQYACTNIQSFNADLSHTISWQGISVTDSTGHAVQNFTAWNPTGDFNYASPVPEPSGVWLALLGCAMMGLRHRAALSAAAEAVSSGRGLQTSA